MTAPHSSRAAHASAGEQSAETVGNVRLTATSSAIGREGTLGRVSRAVRIAAVVVCCLWMLGRAAPVDAACASPRVTVDRVSVARGDIIEIRGEAFGTACNDMGWGGPALGEPQAAIAVRIVQDDISVPVVEVDADADYRFVVRTMVPTTMTKGPAMVRAMSAPLREVGFTIDITEKTVSKSASVPPTVLVGQDRTPPRPAAPDDGSIDTSSIVVLVAVLVASVVVSMVLRQRRTTPRRWIAEFESLS